MLSFAPHLLAAVLAFAGVSPVAGGAASDRPPGSPPGSSAVTGPRGIRLLKPPESIACAQLPVLPTLRGSGAAARPVVPPSRGRSATVTAGVRFTRNALRSRVRFVSAAVSARPGPGNFSVRPPALPFGASRTWQLADLSVAPCGRRYVLRYELMSRSRRTLAHAAYRFRIEPAR